jgi:transcriptional antiterminator
MSKTEALGLGEFPYPEWHKKEKENILSNVGIQVEYGEPVVEGEYRGTFKTVSDKEHAEIIKLYIGEDLSIDKLAKQFNRSSRTPLVQINKHNHAVERSGFCPICRRVRSGLEGRSIRRG